jgi:hypothetical protein
VGVRFPLPAPALFGINLLDYRKWLLAEEINSARTAETSSPQ